MQEKRDSTFVNRWGIILAFIICLLLWVLVPTFTLKFIGFCLIGLLLTHLKNGRNTGEDKRA